jgi:DNA-directed RNA polymerase subunit RPC12/RpoP
MTDYTCADCGATVDYLEVFPGPRCLECWTPIGEAQARTMTAERLTRMWGG